MDASARRNITFGLKKFVQREREGREEGDNTRRQVLQKVRMESSIENVRTEEEGDKVQVIRDFAKVPPK